MHSPSFTRRGLLGAGAATGAAMLTQLAPGLAQAQSAPPARQVLWAANMRNKSLDDRLLAASLGKFTHMSIFPIDWRTWTEQGQTPAEMRRKIEGAGISVLAIDPFVQWIAGFAIPAGYPADYVSFIDFPEADILRIAEETGAEAINCVEGLGQPHEEAMLVDALGAFADRAAAQGLRITLEFMPISSITDLAAGWSILSKVGRTNAGLCFDTWHYFRSTPDPDLLASIPGERIFEVQLADALLALQAPTLTEDLLRFRRLPGDGEMDIAGVSSILKSTGAWNSVGPEVFADAMDQLSASDVGLRARAAFDRFLT